MHGRIGGGVGGGSTWTRPSRDPYAAARWGELFAAWLCGDAIGVACSGDVGDDSVADSCPLASSPLAGCVERLGHAERVLVAVLGLFGEGSFEHRFQRSRRVL